ATVEQKAQNRLEELCKSITLALPHEFRTPLNGIISSSELLIQDFAQMDHAEVMDMLTTIHSSAKRLHRLIQNFLLYSELTASTPERIEAQQRSSTGSNSKAIITMIAQQKADQFNRPDDLHLNLVDAIVHISDVKLTKILEELLDNAFKFSEPETPVQVVTKLYNDKLLALYVIDKGRGMTAEQISRLGAYMQFERDLYEQQGAGLGLMIVKRLAEIHGGSLTLDSIPNQQTTVCVTLRLQEQDSIST
ncbi:MAG: HAMP domain-containing histidine kinase, partial [Cyanobacteria bacterium]|nr:HAMP domain-containing histidine kinase [Cyanobacteriota bacterium]MDW8203008.1 HAMP domain-containing sensor histidine kinase [Cyanobacteriota bacterium SKYGB_h_bin112]